MANNPEYVELLKKQKTTVTEQYNKRVSYFTRVLKDQYDKQIAFIDELIAKNSTEQWGDYLC